LGLKLHKSYIISFSRISMNHHSPHTEIPIIDISSLLTPDYKPDSTSKEIGDACRDMGFFYVVNHGISKAHREEVFRESKAFFQSPLEKKNEISSRGYDHYAGYVPMHGEITKGTADTHEAYDIIRETPPSHPDVLAGHPTKGPNQWPTWMKSFKGTMIQNWDLMENLGMAITKGIFQSLGLEKQLMDQYMRDPVSEQRALFYPGTKIKEQGIGAHKDYGFVTMVMQDTPGLEVLAKDGSWTTVEEVPNSFIVNLGYMVERWTNWVYPATEHKVRTSKKDRTSVIFFTGPSTEIDISPLESCCTEGNPGKFATLNYGDYIKRKFAASYES